MRRIMLLLALLAALSPAAASESFDYDAALAKSQAALGNRVGDHVFHAADGQRLGLAELRGKPLVLSLIFTSCHHVCPMTTRHLKTVVDKARAALGAGSFAVATIGFDTAVDTPAAMRFFAARQGIDVPGWHALSASAETIAALSADTGFEFYPTSAGFDHVIQATVLDADGRVYRQVYGQAFDTPLLVDPLIELVLGRAAPEQALLTTLIDKIKLFCTIYDLVRDGYYFDYSLFLGLAIGATIIAFAGTFVFRAWRG